MGRPRDRIGGIGGTLVLDANALIKLARGHPGVLAHAKAAYARHADVVTAATTLADVLRGGPRDVPFRQVLQRIRIVPIGPEQAQAAGELLGRTGLSGHHCALDALLAAVALAQPQPVILLASNTDDMSQLTYRPGRPVDERVAVVRT
jgi:predicted nucleic acid-binding protein